MCGAAGLPPADFVTCGNLDGLCLSDRDYPRVLLPSGTAGTAGVILIVGVMPAGPRLATDVAISPSRKWIFIGSAQFLHLVSMRVVLDCGVVGPSGGYRMSGLRREGPVFF